MSAEFHQFREMCGRYVGLLALLRECFCLGICISAHFVAGELLKSYTANPLTDVMDCCSFMSLSSGLEWLELFPSLPGWKKM